MKTGKIFGNNEKKLLNSLKIVYSVYNQTNQMVSIFKILLKIFGGLFVDFACSFYKILPPWKLAGVPSMKCFVQRALHCSFSGGWKVLKSQITT